MNAVLRDGAEKMGVARLIETQALEPHFQPIVQLGDGVIRGHEALIRTPPGCRWPTPDTLFAAAREEGLTIELEIECVRLALRAWARSGAQGELFVNLSAAALVTVMAQRDIDSIIALSQSTAVARGGIVVELTEHEHVRDFDSLAVAVGRLRRHKVAVALDDFGDGRSSLRLWSQLKPEIVKIDKYFCHELSQHAEKLQTLRALLQISKTLGSVLVVEGIENAADLHLVRDLGIGLGQGWAFGRPAALPASTANHEALAVIRSKDIAVFPERRRNGGQQRASAWNLMREVEPALPQTTNQELFERFSADSKLYSIAIVDDGIPVGLVSRQHFIDRYAKLYVRELYGRKSCTIFANMTPRLVDLQDDLDALMAVLTSEDQRYLAEGVIITQFGRYRGLGSGEDLVRAVSESRIEAARHANPLTLLPGNIPLTQHIKRLQEAGREFVACYADLNQFKPFNDQYGYWRGDDMILLAARCISEQADPRRDFVGHVGGDDFVVLFQSNDWERRSHAIVEMFNAAAVELYDEEARAAGGLMAEDRHGDMRFHPLTTLCIGAVPVRGGVRMGRPEDVANSAALAKRRAKSAGAPLYVLAD